MLYLILYVCVFMHRPETAESQLLPCPSVNHDGESWENESTTSSASNTEYTGTLWKKIKVKGGLFRKLFRLEMCSLEM